MSAASTTIAALDRSLDCELTTIQVTGTMQYDGATPSISGGLGFSQLEMLALQEDFCIL